MVIKNKTIDTSKLNQLIKKTPNKVTAQPTKKEPDIVRSILVNKLIYDGEDSLDASEKAYLHYTKPRETKPSDKRGLNTVVYDGSKPTHKPTYRRGDAKIIVDELKKDKRKNNPLLRQKPFKLNFDMPVSLIKETPEEKLQRENFEKILEDSKREKQRARSGGLAYLMGSPTITESPERIENNVQQKQEEDYDL